MTMPRQRVILMICSFIIVALLATVITGVQFPSYGPSVISSQIGSEAIVSPATCTRPAGDILIIADLGGFNDSISHGAPADPWPIIRVSTGKTVDVIVCNLDSTQPHGFAIDHYLPAGIPIRSGEAYKISFVADVSGDFAIYCTIFCTIHVFMRGQLIVG